MNASLQVKCPQCGKVFSYYESEFRPFCCEKCKMIDLGHWFEESYRVPTKEDIQTEQNKKEKKQNEESSEEDESESEGYETSYENNYENNCEDDENNY